jgi:hypothetical protein
VGAGLVNERTGRPEPMLPDLRPEFSGPEARPTTDSSLATMGREIGGSATARALELYRMTDLEAVASLEREFPGVTIYRSSFGSPSARWHDNGDSVRGEDWADLRDAIRRVIGRAK